MLYKYYLKLINPILYIKTMAIAIGAINFTKNIKPDSRSPDSFPPIATSF